MQDSEIRFWRPAAGGPDAALTRARLVTAGPARPSAPARRTPAPTPARTSHAEARALEEHARPAPLLHEQPDAGRALRLHRLRLRLGMQEQRAADSIAR